jgi:hypothetical protein
MSFQSYRTSFHSSSVSCELPELWVILNGTRERLHDSRVSLMLMVSLHNSQVSLNGSIVSLLRKKIAAGTYVPFAITVENSKLFSSNYTKY